MSSILDTVLCRADTAWIYDVSEWTGEQPAMAAARLYGFPAADNISDFGVMYDRVPDYYSFDEDYDYAVRLIEWVQSTGPDTRWLTTSGSYVVNIVRRSKANLEKHLAEVNKAKHGQGVRRG